jgi:hypothetical protein
MNEFVDPNPAAPGNGHGQQGTREQLAERAKSMAEARKGQLSERMAVFGRALEQTAEQLRYEGGEQDAGYVESLGEGVSRVARYLESHDTTQLVNEVERFARRQPVIFFGGAFAVGFLAARFLKSSVPEPGEGQGGP